MLAQCPNCHTKISSRSIQCPECHGPLKQKGRDASRIVFVWTFVLFNVLMLLWLAFYLTTGRLTFYAPRIDEFGGAAVAPVAGGMGIGFLCLLWLIGLLILGICAAFNFAHQASKQPARKRAVR